MADRTVTTRLKLAVTDFVAGGRTAKSTLRDLDRKFSESAGFAAGFRKKLEDAAKRLPPIEIDVNSSAAEVKIAEIRSRLESLSSKSVGVDIDAGEAYAELQALQRELEAIDDKDVAFEVRAGVAQAMSELRAIDSEINRVDSRTASVNVNADVGGALSSIAMVGAALAALPAVTSIAVGVTALGGAFLAAGAGAAAFGAVAVPALGRINAALTAQESAAKSAGAATGGAGQSAAQAAIQAMQLEQAEKRLKDAQNERKQAQEDLTRAVEAGRRALEDMNFSLERSVLSQKDAALAVREAEARLAELRAGGKASDLDIERAMLNVEMAHQRAREQETKTQRAKKDTAEANQAGVKGTQEYQKGLDKLAQAENKVAEATAALKQMQLQQQAAMSGGGGGAAKLTDAFAGLSKQEKVLAKDIKAFKDEYVDWQKALEPDVFPAIHQGLDLMRLGLEAATPLAKTAGASFLTLGKEAETALRGPFWQKFLYDLNTAAPTALIGLGRSFGNVTTGVAGVIDAFLPFTPTVVGGVEKATAAFSEWGQKLKDSPEFHEFLLFVKENAPEVLELAKNLATTLGKIGEAVGPLGVGAFGGLALLAKLTAGMDPEHIQLIALAIIAIKTAQAGLGVARFFTEIPGKLGSVRDGFDKAKTAGSKFGNMVGGLKDKIDGAGALIGGAVLTGGLLLLEDRLNKNALAAGRFAEKIEALAGGNVDSQIKAFSDEIARLKDAMGPSLDLGAINLAPFDWDNSLDKIDALQKKLDDLRHQKELDAIASRTAGNATATMGGQMAGATEKVSGLNSSLDTFSSKTDLARRVLELKDAFNQAKDAIAAAGGRLDITAGMTDKQREAVVKARDQFGGYIEKVRAAADGAQTLSGKTSDATRAVLLQLPELGKLAGKNQEAREQILKLAEAYGISREDAIKAMSSAKGLRDMLAQLKSKEIQITANTEKARQALKDLLNIYIKPIEIPISIKAPTTQPKKKERGGVERYAAGGVRSTPPNVAASPTILYGEGAAAEYFIPTEMKYRGQAEALLAQAANEFGLTLGNQRAAESLSDLNVTIDGSGLKIAAGLESVMGSLQATMGQAGSLTSSITNVSASADQLNESWQAGSDLMADSMSKFGAITADSFTIASESVDGLTASVQELIGAIASADDAAGGSKSKSKSKGKGKAGAKPTNMIDGFNAGGFVSNHASALTSGSPVNSSRVSAPQQVSSSSTAARSGGGGVPAAGGSGGGAGQGGGPAVAMYGTTFRETVDVDIFTAKVGMVLDSRG